ncbi:MAG: hypothetical protein P4L80_09745 [Xanthobacteraceae bacterium]|nr:hypothetical protein [Xanthobacteraceae bacterium]
MPTIFSSLISGQPRIDIKQTTITDGTWTVSGTVIFELKPERVVPGAKLEFPFDNAKDEHEAIEQAARQLKLAADAFLNVAQTLLGPGKDAQR